jgi:hypothetical protein
MQPNHRDAIEQMRLVNRARQQAAKQKPVPQRIGDRDPVTGNYSALYPDGSETANGRKLYDAHSVRSDRAAGLPLNDGTIGLLGQKGQLSPLALPEQEGVRGIATQGPLKDNNVGYINGQVWNYEEEVVEEIAFELFFFGIRATDQVYTFRGGGVTKEISFANAETFDLFGVGQIRTRLRTTNRKLRLTFEAAIDGTKSTNVGCSFHTVKTIKLPVTITAQAAVSNGESSNVITGEPEFVPDLINWLILNNINLTDSDAGGSDFDLTTFVDAPFPAESSGFINRNPGEYTADRVIGTIPPIGPTRDHFIFIFADTQNVGQRSYYTYKTTWEFAFK